MKKKYSFFKNASYALAGVKRALNESAFRIEFVIGICFILFALFYPFSLFEKAFLIGVIILVLAAECFNTAIESVVDLATSKYHKLAKDAKDLGSAGVFFTILIAVLTWLSVLYKEFL
ncbi:diacylglycerol kinase [Campylobacter sp. RM12642]|uniref:diacylglycerol kinase n=1 Tax=Campylobacter sp. RM12642 TaxID=2735736 RepID=UPI0030145389|nr:diacylglycerol kinase [Campylobacter sp. RM12642]